MNVSKRSNNAKPNRGIGQRSARKWATCLLAVVLALTVIVPAYPAERASAASVTTASQGGFTQDQLDGLAYLNEIRAKVGVGPLELDASLTQASQAHAAYYNTTHFEGLSAHREEPGTAGFTGVTAGDRGRAAGWPNTSVAEVMSFNNATTREAIDSWLSTAYHRKIILDDRYTSVGIGLQSGTAVMNPAYVKFQKEGTEAKVYPYDGMKGADVGFYGNEIPNPLVRFGVEHSGGIISATAGFAIDSFEANIVDSQGQEVPYNSELQGDTVFLYPKDVLDGYSVYTVKLDYTLYKESQLRSKTWSFMTGKGRTIRGLSAQYDELVLNPGSKLPIQITASYDDGTFGTPKTAIAYSSSSPAGLKVSAEGTLSGVKPGSYKVTFSAGAVRGTVPVRVFERLKSKSYPATDPTKVKDIAGRSDQAAIEWALRSGVTGVDTNGKFRPEDSVSEAQFLIMLLRTYKVDDESYASKKKQHWAEGAYKVASARNLLLFSTRPGKSDFRNKPINRYRAAGMIASADGVNFDFPQAVNYVLAHNYMRGTEGNQSWMFGSNDIVTRAQAAVILMQLQSGMKQLVGAPKKVTSEKKLPEQLFPEVYIKPALGSKTMIAEFRADGTLSVEGKFANHANKQLEIQIDQRQDNVQSGKMLETIPVLTDSSGRFSISSTGSYGDAILNVFLRTEEATYYIGVKRGTMNASDYSS
ncbi:CAP domain-containing protein [Paenibacillus pabuli]|uniref:CAP and S-layer homology domain-containing protein n=1 Tax=Paenibacillus pabuli TaxID=1472 RepID=UPI003458DA5B